MSRQLFPKGRVANSYFILCDPKRFYNFLLYVVFQSSIGDAFKTARKHLRLRFYKNRQQFYDAACFRR